MDKDTVEYIINVLRRGTITWEGRTQCLNRGRYKIAIDNKKLWARDCDGCGEVHLQKNNDLEVDHIIEIGGFKGNWNDFIPRMYCKQSNLQALCFVCHSIKTSNYNSQIKYKRKAKAS